jgi:hypothetical protein
MVPVPVPSFEKVTVPVLLGKLFHKEKVHKFQQIYG